MQRLCVAALAGAMFVAGCGSSAVAASPTATATNAPTVIPTPSKVPAPPPGFTTFHSVDGTFGLNFPKVWQLTSKAANGVTVTKFTNSKDTIIVAPLTLQVPVAQYPTLLQTIATSLFAGTNVTIIATSKQETIGTNVWNAVSGTMTLNGVDYDIAAYGTDHGANTTFFVALAPKATSQVDSTQYIAPMITSFTFLK